MNINEIDWHDQLLTAINIDRSNPGLNDSIELKIILDGVPITIRFEDVYFADLKLNFGVIAEESIRYGYVKADDPEINNIKSKWRNSGDNFKSLMCYEFNTNSTNNLIKIYALSCELIR